MSGLLSPIFLRLGKYNDEEVGNENAKFRVSQNSGVIDQEKYSLSINRVVIPTSRIEHFHVDDGIEKYYVMVGISGDAREGEDEEDYPVPPDVSGVGYLLDDKGGNRQWLANTVTVGEDFVLEKSNYKYLNPNYNGSTDLIYENINRAFARAYLGAFYNLDYAGYYFRRPLVPTYVREFQTALRKYKWKYPHVPLSVIQSGSVELGTFNFMTPDEQHFDHIDDWGHVCGMMLHVKEFRARYSPKIYISWWVYNEPGFDHHYTHVANIDVRQYELVSPPYTDAQGNTVRKHFAFIPNRTKIDLVNVYISEGAMVPLSSQVHSSEINNVHVQPVDSFQEANDIPFLDGDNPYNYPDNIDGKWTLRMIFDGDYYSGLAEAEMTVLENGPFASYGGWKTVHYSIDLPDADIDMYCFSNFGHLPTLTPTIGKTDNGTTELQVQNAWLNGSTQAFLSPRLNELLNMGVGYNNEVLFNDMRVFKIISPHANNGIPTTMNYITFTGTHNQISNHTNIKSIDIVSSGLSVNTEIQGDESVNDILMSLVINPDSLNNTQLVYNYGGPAVPAKRFYFNTPGRLAHFEVYVYVTYKDGHRKLLDIGPGEYAEILLSFDPLFKR